MWRSVTAEPAQVDALRAGQSVGRPLMSEDALRELERKLDRPILPRKRGRKPSAARDSAQRELV